MTAPSSAGTISGVCDGSAWAGDAKAQLAALDVLLSGEVRLVDAENVPDGIRAYVARKQNGVYPLESVPSEALGDTDEAAAERCRRMFIDWAKEVGIDRVRWITKAEGNREADVAAYAAYQADDLYRLMALIRHKHRDEPDWNPGTPDEFAADMLLRQARDLSMGYRTRGILGSSWKEYAKLSQAAQGNFEGRIVRIVALAQVRRAAQVAAFNRAFDDRPLPTTKEESDQLLADMFSHVLGRPVDPPARDAVTPVGADDDDDEDDEDDEDELEVELEDELDGVDVDGRTYDDVIADVKGRLTGDFQADSALITSVAQSTGDHPQGTEIRRELGRMLHRIAPEDVRPGFDKLAGDAASGFDEGLAEARAHIAGNDVAAARTVLEDLLRRFGSGTGLFLDDGVSEYRHFANEVELMLYAELYPSDRVVRKLPQDRAALFSLYGSVLLELRDAAGAEAALRESLRVNPVSTETIFELGEVMKLTGRQRELRELTLRALAVAYSLSALGRAYRNLGYLAVEDGDFELAVACYCLSLAIDRDHAQAAQSELFYIQQVAGRTLDMPDRASAEAILARNGIQVGPSRLVRQLMDAVG